MHLFAGCSGEPSSNRAASEESPAKEGAWPAAPAVFIVYQEGAIFWPPRGAASYQPCGSFYARATTKGRSLSSSGPRCLP